MNDAFLGTDDESTDDGSASMAVVNAVANRQNVDPIELPPLYEWIDPNALDALFEPTKTCGPRRGRVEFEYAGYRVVVERDSSISVTLDRATELESSTISEVDDRQTNA